MKSNELTAYCDTLKRIAENYPAESDEAHTLRRAACGLQLLFEKKLGEELDELIQSVGQPLTSVQKEHLRELGILAEGSDTP